MTVIGFDLTSARAATPQFKPAVAPIDAGSDFRFHYYSTDVMAWARGDREGPVKDVRGPMADALRKFLGTAKNRLRLAAYGVESQAWVFQTLRGLVARGVDTYAVVDQVDGDVGDWEPSNFTYADTFKLPDVLTEDQIAVDQSPDGDVRTSTIMHNKFAVVDTKGIWTGSANLSATCMGAEYNANTAIHIESSALARIYAKEFDQMEVGHRFSIYKKGETRAPVRFKDGTEVRVYFSPKDDTINAGVLPFIAMAEDSLDIGMFFLTDDSVVKGLVAARKRGVKVRIIYDALAAANEYSLHRELRKAGVQVRVENWGGKMHMKDAVADRRHVFMGSMNWSANGANQNDENSIVILNNQELGRQAGDYFDALWATLPASAADPRAEGRASINSCVDGLDNDFDGQTDDEDSGCD